MFFNENYMTDMKRENRNRLNAYLLLCMISFFIVLVSGCVEDGISLEEFSVTFENQSGDTIYYVTHFCYPSYSAEKQDLDLEESDIVHIMKHGERDEYLKIYSIPLQQCL